MAIVYVIMAITNIIGVIMLAPSMGAIGICISVCVAYLVRTVGMDIILVRDLHIDIVSFLKETFVKMSYPLAICIVLGFAGNYLIPFNSWFGFVLKGGLFVWCYAIVMYFIAMNNSEKDLIVKPIKRIIHHDR